MTVTDLKRYFELTARTDSPITEINQEILRLCHYSLGISSEIEEYINATDEVNEKEELADMMWYIGRMWELLDLGEVEVKNPKLSKYRADTLMIYSGKIADTIKKSLAYGIEVNKQEIKECLERLIFFINLLLGDDFIKSLQNNIDKLYIRYPEKFSNENALNRDLENERKELEK